MQHTLKETTESSIGHKSFWWQHGTPLPAQRAPLHNAVAQQPSSLLPSLLLYPPVPQHRFAIVLCEFVLAVEKQMIDSVASRKWTDHCFMLIYTYLNTPPYQKIHFLCSFVSFHSICHNVSFSIYKSAGRKALQTSILKVLISLHFQDCFCPPTPSGIPLWRETGGLQNLKVTRLRWSSLGLCI